jgi:hypothetical protein
MQSNPAHSLPYPILLVFVWGSRKDTYPSKAWQLVRNIAKTQSFKKNGCQAVNQQNFFERNSRKISFSISRFCTNKIKSAKTFKMFWF